MVGLVGLGGLVGLVGLFGLVGLVGRADWWICPLEVGGRGVILQLKFNLKNMEEMELIELMGDCWVLTKILTDENWTY